MREYGKVFTTFWTNAELAELSDRAKLLALYLLTGTHGNMIGCFRLPVAYIATDMRWPNDATHEAMTHLGEADFARYCSATQWVFLPKYLEWNPLHNPNQHKAAVKLVELVPRKSQVFPALVSALQPFRQRFPQGFMEGLGQPVAVAVSSNSTQEQEQEISPALLAPQPQAPAKPDKKGCRIPDDFEATADHLALAKELGVDAARELPKFRDYFAAKAGREAVKLDWDATFRNWLRNAASFAGAPKGTRKPDFAKTDYKAGEQIPDWMK